MNTNQDMGVKRTIDDLPCRDCPHGADVRSMISQSDSVLDEHQCSPTGLPLNCCRIRVVGAMPGDRPSTGRARY